MKHADLLPLGHMLIGLHGDLTAGDLHLFHRDKSPQSYFGVARFDKYRQRVATAVR